MRCDLLYEEAHNCMRGCRGEVVEMAKPGQMVKFVGTLIVVPDVAQVPATRACFLCICKLKVLRFICAS
jgi:hypothetical protein